MLLIISRIWALTFINQSRSPFKLSLFLTITRTLIRGVLYLMCNSIFIPCSLIISFSSGIIILFLYCSLCSTYERKNNLKINTIISVTIIITLALYIPEEKYMYSLEKTINITRFSYSLVFVMFIVIISIKCINMSFFNPTKKIIQSYSWINKEIKNNPPLFYFHHHDFLLILYFFYHWSSTKYCFFYISRTKNHKVNALPKRSK